MYGMTDLQRITGYTRDQLRTRLGALGDTVGQDAHRGPRNAIIVGDATVAMLRRMKDIESGGVGPQEAAIRILGEVSGGGKQPRERNSQEIPSSPQLSQTESPGGPNWIDPRVIESLERVIAEQQARIRSLETDLGHWRDLALDYQRQLPAPKPQRQRRWLFWRRPAGVEA